MACLGIRHGGVGDCMIRKPGCGYSDDISGRVSGSKHLSFPNLAVKLPNPRISTAVNATPACDSGRRSALSIIDGGLDLHAEKTVKFNVNDYNDRTSIESPRVSEKLDEWMRNSVTEIVRNIKQAPLLVQIYADGEVKTEKAAAAENWPNVIRNRSLSPEGIIFVEELRENTDQADSDAKSDEEDGSRAFGVLIQGRIKGRDQCRSACYLLKTSSVNGGGMGGFCTHFCLTKVHSFQKSALSQFNDCWLVR